MSTSFCIHNIGWSFSCALCGRFRATDGATPYQPPPDPWTEARVERLLALLETIAKRLDGPRAMKPATPCDHRTDGTTDGV